MSIIIGKFSMSCLNISFGRLQRIRCYVWMERKNVRFHSSLFSFHRCYRRTWSCLPFISGTYSYRTGFNNRFMTHLFFSTIYIYSKMKTIKVYFQNVEKFFLNTPYTTCIKTEAVNNYTKWRNQVDQYRKETNQVNTRKNPTIYKKSQEKFERII